MRKVGARKVFATFMLVLALVLASIFLFPSDTAFAVLPVGFVSDVVDNNLDWWLGEDFIDICRLKQTVDLWKSDSAFDFSNLQPVVIAVVDSGITADHVLFTGKYGEDGISYQGETDANGIGEYDVLLRDKFGKLIATNTTQNRGYTADFIKDDVYNFHGTHVAGIIATLIHALDLENYIKILPIKAGHKSWSNGHYEAWFDGSAVSDAVKFAVSKGASVINMSISASDKSFAISEIEKASGKTVLVAAAGNQASNTTKYYPAAYSNVIGVMNHDASGKLYFRKNELGFITGGTNYGAWYDVCAPGVNIFSADGSSTEGYAKLNGTSMSTPMVAFGAALATLKYRALKTEYGGGDKTPNEITDMVRAAHTSVTSHNGVEYPIFDINALVLLEDAIIPENPSETVRWYGAKVEVQDSSSAIQHLGDLKNISLFLNPLPAQMEGKGIVKWFIGDEKIGEGFNLEYTPDATAGKFDISAIWSFTDENGQSRQIKRIFAVEVKPQTVNKANLEKYLSYSITEDEVKSTISQTAQYTIGKTYEFSIGNLENFENIGAEDIVWYVNEVKVGAGDTFEFCADKAGQYDIKVKIQNISIGVARVKADYDLKTKNNRELIIYTAVSCAIIVAVVGVVAAVLIIKQRHYAINQTNDSR